LKEENKKRVSAELRDKKTHRLHVNMVICLIMFMVGFMISLSLKKQYQTPCLVDSLLILVSGVLK